MNKENQKIEYKSSWKDEYLKWICGFDNSNDEKIYIGIGDNVRKKYKYGGDVNNG